MHGHLNRGERDIDWAGLQIELELALQRLVRRELQSRPLLILMMQTPEDGKTKTHRKVTTKVSEDNISEDNSNSERPAPIGRRKQRSTAKVGS